MTKYDLLRLLDDAEIQRKILKIVNEPNVFEEPQEKIPETRQTINEKIPAADDSAEKNLQRATGAEIQLNNLRGEYFKLKSDLAQSEQRVKNLERKLQTAFNENSRLDNSLAQVQKRAQKFQEDALAWKDSCEDERERAKDLQRELDTAQDKISRLERENFDLKAQNEQRFARGWELFKKYPRVGAHARQLLQTGVFPHENNFMSFICGGAQTDSLEKIWDVLRECVMNGKQQDAEILWEVFEYCLELVNSSKSQPGYSILHVKEGDRFDSELHSEGPNSRAQGKISAVYLPGYRNDYSKRIIKRSIVQVS